MKFKSREVVVRPKHGTMGCAVVACAGAILAAMGFAAASSSGRPSAGAAAGAPTGLVRPAGAAGKAPATVFVNTKFGGFILGYDIDQRGTEGLLSESVALGDGKQNVAIETFDQKTGNILDVVSSIKDTKNDFVTFGIFGGGVGLVEEEIVQRLFVSNRLYETMKPVSLNMLNGKWTPPLDPTMDLIIGVAPNQGTGETAMMYSHNDGNSVVFSTNVAQNTFGESFTLSDPVFDFNDSPVIGYNSALNQAVVASSGGGIKSVPQIATVDLAAGTTNEFTGLGFGFVNGIAVDSANNMACTTTEVDFSIEIYNLATGQGIIEPLHNATNQAESGGAVAFDPIHKWFLVGQEFSSVAPSGSSIQVFDEQGNFIEAINGLSLPASPAYMALKPAARMGYVIVTPALSSLQSFQY